MCGRFTLTADGETVRAEFGLPAVPFDYRPRYNIAPMQEVLAIVQQDGAPRAGWLRWGLVPGWAEDPAIGARMINARSETIDEKSAFREAFERRRCLIVADGFYEWQQVGALKVPMRVRLRNERPFAFAGLWEKRTRGGEPLFTCTILTTTPSPSIADLHDRMPVMLDAGQRQQWLDRDADTEQLKALLRPFPDQELEAYAVSTRVNHVDNDSPACVAPAAEPPQDSQTSLFGDAE